MAAVAPAVRLDDIDLAEYLTREWRMMDYQRRWVELNQLVTRYGPQAAIVRHMQQEMRPAK